MPSLLDEDPYANPDLLGVGPSPDALAQLYHSVTGYMRGTPPPVDPSWPVSNPVGTEQLVDYSGYDRPATAAPTAPATRDLPRDPATQKTGSFISEGFPAALNAVFPMLPAASGWGSKFFGLSQAPRTGDVTPRDEEELRRSLATPGARPARN